MLHSAAGAAAGAASAARVAGAENRAAGIVTHAAGVNVIEHRQASRRRRWRWERWRWRRRRGRWRRRRRQSASTRTCPGLHGVAWRLARPWSDSFRKVASWPARAAETRAAPQFCPSAPRSGLWEKGTLTLLLPPRPDALEPPRSRALGGRLHAADPPLSSCTRRTVRLEGLQPSPLRAASQCPPQPPPSSLPVSCLPPPLPSPQPQPSLLPPSSGRSCCRAASSRGSSPCTGCAPARARRCRCRRSPCTGRAAARART